MALTGLETSIITVAGAIATGFGVWFSMARYNKGAKTKTTIDPKATELNANATSISGKDENIETGRDGSKTIVIPREKEDYTNTQEIKVAFVDELKEELIKRIGELKDNIKTELLIELEDRTEPYFKIMKKREFDKLKNKRYLNKTIEKLIKKAKKNHILIMKVLAGSKFKIIDAKVIHGDSEEVLMDVLNWAID